MGKYFCVYCDVDPDGHHVKGCPKYRTPEENAERVMDKFDELLKDLAKAGGFKVPFERPERPERPEL